MTRPEAQSMRRVPEIPIVEHVTDEQLAGARRMVHRHRIDADDEQRLLSQLGLDGGEA